MHQALNHRGDPETKEACSQPGEDAPAEPRRASGYRAARRTWKPTRHIREGRKGVRRATMTHKLLQNVKTL